MNWTESAILPTISRDKIDLRMVSLKMSIPNCIIYTVRLCVDRVSCRVVSNYQGMISKPEIQIIIKLWEHVEDIRNMQRVQYVLRLILKYMEKHPSIENFLTEMKDTDKSSYMTLGRTLRVLWSHHKVLFERISQNKSIKSENINERYLTNKISQDFRTIEEVRYCKSCVLASKTILQIIDIIEEVFREYKLSSVTVLKSYYTSKNGSKE